MEGEVVERGIGQDIMSNSGNGRRKLSDSDVNPPELPPRPPPCPRHREASALQAHLSKRRLRKYVFLCTFCGGLATLLGGLFLAVYLILRSYTSSLDYFETIPTYIPATMLLITGLGIMCLARRRNRYAILIKLCGVCCLLCAATCVLVTVTTTVIHMSRLQSLRECVYTLKTQTCTCYSMLLESASERTDEGAHYVFNSTPDCEVIHGALYSCLRAMFGLSVIGILVCIFCCMLVYQLLSHERKKMYWEQLELRCRYLYGQPRNQPVITPQRCNHCACTQQYRYPNEGMFDNRLWAGGRIGNLYSPNPVGDEAPPSTGWGWRLPWSRSDNSHQHPQPEHSCRESGYHRPLGCSSPDSNYGFAGQGVATVSSATSHSYTMIDPPCQAYQWGPPPPYSDPNSPRRMCPPGHHTCTANRLNQENYVNAPVAASPAEELRSMRMRRAPESSSSSVKSEDRNKPQAEEMVSPRMKYLRQSAHRPNPHKRRELTESEVYFADVSSCCNGSMRHDSLVYDEPVNEGGEGQGQPSCHKEHSRKQPRFVLERNLRLQIQQDKEFQKIPEERASPEAISEVAMDGSEDDDPELVSFSQRHASRNRITDATRSQCRNRLDLTQMNPDFPSPMSISSPSTASKDMPFFADAGNSDNGSADSMWGRYSPEFLAPDAQYETIPEHRTMQETSRGSPCKMLAGPRGNNDWTTCPEEESRFAEVVSPRKRTLLVESGRGALSAARPDVHHDSTGHSSMSNDSSNFAEDEHEIRNRNIPNETREFIASQRRKFSATNCSPKHKMGSPICSYDRCGNLAKGYFEEHRDKFESSSRNDNDWCSSSERIHSPKHHYEQIKEVESGQSYEQQKRYDPHCYQIQRSDNIENLSSSETELRNAQNVNSTNSVCNSPQVFDKRLFTTTGLRGSPDCIALVDESQCCHNDSSCRCYISIDSSLHGEPLKSVDI